MEYSAIEQLVFQLEDCGKTTSKLLKLQAIEKTSSLFSTLMMQLLFVSIIAIIFLLITIALALYIGLLLGKLYYGFLIMALCYIILGLVLYFFRFRWIKLPLLNALIVKLNNNEQD